MFIEVLHDQDGVIQGCYCVDTLPANPASRLFTLSSVPEGWTQAWANIDTLTAMEIEAACGERAVVDPASGLPEIVSMDRARYVADNFRVDLSGECQVPSGVVLPDGLKVRALARR